MVARRGPGPRLDPSPCRLITRREVVRRSSGVREIPERHHGSGNAFEQLRCCLDFRHSAHRDIAGANDDGIRHDERRPGQWGSRRDGLFRGRRRWTGRAIVATAGEREQRDDAYGCEAKRIAQESRGRTQMRGLRSPRRRTCPTSTQKQSTPPSTAATARKRAKRQPRAARPKRMAFRQVRPTSRASATITPTDKFRGRFLLNCRLRQKLYGKAELSARLCSRVRTAAGRRRRPPQKSRQLPSHQQSEDRSESR